MGYFELFDCGKEFLNKLNVMHNRACMASAKENYWSEFHQIIINLNDQNDTPLSNVNIGKSKNQVILEERVIAEANNITVDMFMGSPQRN